MLTIIDPIEIASQLTAQARSTMAFEQIGDLPESPRAAEGGGHRATPAVEYGGGSSLWVDREHCNDQWWSRAAARWLMLVDNDSNESGSWSPVIDWTPLSRDGIEGQQSWLVSSGHG
ncbi:hypothetical protein CDL15_Pgr017705 [Punica granatum]|uniref:Uncharacterized protein n=1 Tax=Punica granatum TaxID=22663 RepID=A0A218WII7_PUNGR|nr:hypothetical protein CDL15_Pgr017705 [Punica granatum]